MRAHLYQFYFSPTPLIASVLILRFRRQLFLYHNNTLISAAIIGRRQLLTVISASKFMPGTCYCLRRA